jgi:hypothetical protein
VHACDWGGGTSIYIILCDYIGGPIKAEIDGRGL